jgi:lipoyl(octanoyl) transferase
MAAVLAPIAENIVVRALGRTDYARAWDAMRAFTAARTAATPDELWLLEHPPVYTMGLQGHARVPSAIGEIPVVPTDRGGDMTYHGPGQLVVYCLLDLTRRGLGVEELVRRLEQAVIDLIADYSIVAERRAGAPGVYVEGKKVAALGLRVRNGRCYHGLALNVDMDLDPFARIDPCGYPGLGVTQLAALGVTAERGRVRDELLARLLSRLGYNRTTVTGDLPIA